MVVKIPLDSVPRQFGAAHRSLFQGVREGDEVAEAYGAVAVEVEFGIVGAEPLCELDEVLEVQCAVAVEVHRGRTGRAREDGQGLGASWEDEVESAISSDDSLAETEREALIRARMGQGRFRRDLMGIEKSCRVTGVAEVRHLVASHTKPWRDCSNQERFN